MPTTMTFEEYRLAVSREMERLYGITWKDADGGDKLLIRAHEDGFDYELFVRWYGEKYGLVLLPENW